MKNQQLLRSYKAVIGEAEEPDPIPLYFNLTMRDDNAIVLSVSTANKELNNMTLLIIHNGLLELNGFPDTNSELQVIKKYFKMSRFNAKDFIHPTSYLTPHTVFRKKLLDLEPCDND